MKAMHPDFTDMAWLMEHCLVVSAVEGEKLLQQFREKNQAALKTARAEIDRENMKNRQLHGPGYRRNVKKETGQSPMSPVPITTNSADPADTPHLVEPLQHTPIELPIRSSVEPAAKTGVEPAAESAVLPPSPVKLDIQCRYCNNVFRLAPVEAPEEEGDEHTIE
jgi:hypothetical protein